MAQVKSVAEIAEEKGDEPPHAGDAVDPANVIGLGPRPARNAGV